MATKLVDASQLDSDLTSIANAIRTKGGTSASLDFPEDFIDAIDAIPTGGVDGDNLEYGYAMAGFALAGTAVLLS